jgi:hypothetical protein
MSSSVQAALHVDAFAYCCKTQKALEPKKTKKVKGIVADTLWSMMKLMEDLSGQNRTRRIVGEL